MKYFAQAIPQSNQFQQTMCHNFDAVFKLVEMPYYCWAFVATILQSEDSNFIYLHGLIPLSINCTYVLYMTREIIVKTHNRDLTKLFSLQTILAKFGIAKKRDNGSTGLNM